MAIEFGISDDAIDLVRSKGGKAAIDFISAVG